MFGRLSVSDAPMHALDDPRNQHTSDSSIARREIFWMFMP